MQMEYGQKIDFTPGAVNGGEFNALGYTFQELGLCMMELGLSVARVCDKFIGGCELEQSLLQSGSAKGRLIHYHSVADNSVIKEACAQKQQFRSRKDSEDELWQQWHYDYGMFTVLTMPMFMSFIGHDEIKECESPNSHTHLQVFHPERKRVLMVKAAKGSFIIQVGEAAEVLSNGYLRACLHSVLRPSKLDDNISRETFVVFLQPSWNKTFALANKNASEQFDDSNLNGIISKVIPPLHSRLRDGMTFAEFAKETTKLYYGGGGLQPNRNRQ